MKTIQITKENGGFRVIEPYKPEKYKCIVKENGEISYTIYGYIDHGDGLKPIEEFKNEIEIEKANKIFADFDKLITPLNNKKEYVRDALPDVITLKDGNKKIITVETMGYEKEVEKFYRTIKTIFKARIKENPGEVREYL